MRRQIPRHYHIGCAFMDGSFFPEMDEDRFVSAAHANQFAVQIIRPTHRAEYFRNYDLIVFRFHLPPPDTLGVLLYQQASGRSNVLR